MKNFLTGKIAVVTGGTRGIGRAITERLLLEGASVAFCARTPQNVERAVKEMSGTGSENVFGDVADVSKAEEVERFFQSVERRFGVLDLLVNNAGIGIFRKGAELSVEEWRKTIELNLSGVFYCCREAIGQFRRRGGGYIINISSLAGKNAFAGGAAYNASKFGLNGLSEALMLDYRYDNVRVSYIMPGSVNTEFSSNSGQADWKIAPQDVAEVVVTLLRLPERTLVSRVEMRPSKPMK